MVAGLVAARDLVLVAVQEAALEAVQVLEAAQAPEAALVKAPEAAVGQALAKAPAPAAATKATRTLNKASDSDPKGWFGTDANHSRLYESARQIA